MSKLIFSTSKIINSKPIQVIERNIEYTSNGKKVFLKSHTVNVRDGKTIFKLNDSILTGNNRPGFKYAVITKKQDISRRDTVIALRKTADALFNEAFLMN